MWVNPKRHDQSMAQGSRAFICQRTMGENSLPDYGSVVSVNRPVQFVVKYCFWALLHLNNRKIRQVSFPVCPFHFPLIVKY